MKIAAIFWLLVLGHYEQVASLPTDRALRGKVTLHPDERVSVAANSSIASVANSTSKVLSAAEQALSDFVSRSITNATSTLNSSQVPGYAAYAACHVNPNTCSINTHQVALDLGSRVVLFFGCSLDIYALDYFCKAANAPVIGFTRTPGNTNFEAGNFAYCKIGGLVLAYSFSPGSSGQPYFPECDKVLKGPCAQVTSQLLIQQSIAKVVANFGMPPTAIVMDSSLWDVASWWLRDGYPPEPYVAPPTHLAKFCHQDFPGLLQWIKMASPTSGVAFRTAPRVEFMKGYGHSMKNINSINECFRQSSMSNLMAFKMIDYNSIVELIIARQGGLASSFYEDAFHPAVLPSVIYVDWVLQWAKTLPVGR